MTTFNFEYPWLLLFLPLPLLAQFLLPRAYFLPSSALQIPFFKRLQDSLSNSGVRSGRSYLEKILAWIAWCALVVACAQPAWIDKPTQIPRSGRDLLLAIDLSGSMQIPDMTLHGQTASRLAAIKNVAGKFIDARTGDRLGLILFGTRAYVQTPLTFDTKTVHTMLNDATIGLAGPNTAIGDAIGLAIKRLIPSPSNNRVLVLLTDGENNAGYALPLDAAKLAKKYHIKIYTIGVGSNNLVSLNKGSWFSPQASFGQADVDTKTLQEIADLTGGKFFRAEDTEKLTSIYQELDRLEPTQNTPETFRLVTPLYPWPLGLGLLLAFMLALPRSFYQRR